MQECNRECHHLATGDLDRICTDQGFESTQLRYLSTRAPEDSRAATSALGQETPASGRRDQHPSTTAHIARSGCCRTFPLALEAHIQVSATPVSQLEAPPPCTKHQMLFKNLFRQLLSCNYLLKIPI